jgi:hypothetical protein
VVFLFGQLNVAAHAEWSLSGQQRTNIRVEPHRLGSETARKEKAPGWYIRSRGLDQVWSATEGSKRCPMVALCG